MSIATIQFLSEFIGTYRSCDIDDVILNTLGGFIGIIISKKFQGIVFKKIRIRNSGRTY